MSGKTKSLYYYDCFPGAGLLAEVHKMSGNSFKWTRIEKLENVKNLENELLIINSWSNQIKNGETEKMIKINSNAKRIYLIASEENEKYKESIEEKYKNVEVFGRKEFSEGYTLFLKSLLEAAKK